MNKDINNFLNKAVRDSLGYSPEDAKKYSIIDCAQNMYLNGEYDSIKELKSELMLISLAIRERERLNGIKQ